MGGNELRICGMNAVPSPEITADWIPTAAAEPRMFPCNRSPDRFYGEAELVGWWQAALEDAEKSAEAARLDAARAHLNATMRDALNALEPMGARACGLRACARFVLMRDH